MPVALLALAIGAFGIGTTEFVIMGLLPDVAAGFGVSIPAAGILVTGYALGVVAGAPVMTLLGTRIDHKRMLMLLMGLFTAGNALTAAAPNLWVMLAGRVVASLAHGAFFGIGAVVAAGLVPPRRRAGAIALMFTGLTVANVAGVPLGTWVGQHLSWRVTFAGVAALGIAGLAGVAVLVPAQPASCARRGGVGALVWREVAVFGNPQVLLAMGMTVLGFGGVFAAITYLAPMMTHAAGYSEGAVTWLLMLLGGGMVIGNLLGGRYADRALMPMLHLSLAALSAALLLFTLTAHSKAGAAITIVVIGALGFAAVPPLQKRVVDEAAAAPTLASALNIAAFNLGNALAAWLAGQTISAGWGYTSASWVGAGLAASALVLAAVSAALERRDARLSRGDVPTAATPANATPSAEPLAR